MLKPKYYRLPVQFFFVLCALSVACISRVCGQQHVQLLQSNGVNGNAHQSRVGHGGAGHLHHPHARQQKHNHHNSNRFGNTTNLRVARLPVVYVYTVVPSSCPNGLPGYIKTSLEQGIFSQPDCDVILVSNFADCPTTRQSVESVHGLTLIDCTLFESQRTTEYRNLSSTMFMDNDPLWMTSALRFFVLEDLMSTYGYGELVHVETDNMLYGKLTSLLPTLRAGYHGLAATPLNTDQTFITASVFWIARQNSLTKFTNFLMALATNRHASFKKYLQWLRPYACCKAGGVDPDENGNGIKPFAINEMSMLGYYHHLHPIEFKNLPVVPASPFITNRYVKNASNWAAGGTEVGPRTGHGIWDPNSWGQYIGGTSRRKGKDKGFTDPSHIAGVVIRVNGCTVKMLCGNHTVSPYSSLPARIATAITNKVTAANIVLSDLLNIPTMTASPSISNDSSISKNGSNNTRVGEDVILGFNYINSTQSTTSNNHGIEVAAAATAAGWSGDELKEVLWWMRHRETRCYTAPFVECTNWYEPNKTVPWVPLWNLHVHSKHTVDYKSEVCDCPLLPAEQDASPPSLEQKRSAGILD